MGEAPQPTIPAAIAVVSTARVAETNLHTRAENFLSENPHFAKSAMARYTPADIHPAGGAAWHRLSREDAGAASSATDPRCRL